MSTELRIMDVDEVVCFTPSMQASEPASSESAISDQGGLQLFASALGQRRLRVAAAIGATLLTALAGVLAGQAIGASAYTYTGCKWPSANVTYQNIATGVWNTAAQNAIVQWSGATDVNMSNASGSSLLVTTQYANNGLAGTTSGSCPGGTFGWATVRANTLVSAGLSANCKQQVYGHELGHGLGLDHAPGLVIMFSGTSVCTISGIYLPQLDDRQGINALY